MLDWLVELDQTIFLAINGINIPFLNTIMIYLSKHAIWYPMYALLLIFLGWKKDWKTALFALLAIALTFLLTDRISVFIKLCVERPRPFFDTTLNGAVNLLEKPGGQFGFVSSHAANVFGLATFTFLYFKKRWYTWFIFIWASLIAISRIFVGKHYPLDIICGAIVGALLGLLTYWLFKWAIRKFTMSGKEPEYRVSEPGKW